MEIQSSQAFCSQQEGKEHHLLGHLLELHADKDLLQCLAPGTVLTVSKSTYSSYFTPPR